MFPKNLILKTQKNLIILSNKRVEESRKKITLCTKLEYLTDFIMMLLLWIAPQHPREDIIKMIDPRAINMAGTHQMLPTRCPTP